MAPNLTEIEQGLPPNFIGKGATVGDIIQNTLLYVFAVAGFILLFYLIFGGFKYMSSGGDTKSIDSAKRTITTALIGFIIIFVSFWLVQLIGTIFGITQFQQVFR